MLNAAELASLRGVSDSLLPDTAVIQRVSYTRNADGDQVEAWADLATVACRVGPSGYQTAEPTVAGRTVQQATYIATLAAGTDVTARDRLAWNGRVLQVVSVVPRSNEVSRKAYLSEQV